MFFYLFIVNYRFQVRHSVIVIPRADAESREYQRLQMRLVEYTGFRVGARNDNYREPHLKEKNSQVLILKTSSNHKHKYAYD